MLWDAEFLLWEHLSRVLLSCRFVIRAAANCVSHKLLCLSVPTPVIMLQYVTFCSEMFGCVGTQCVRSPSQNASMIQYTIQYYYLALHRARLLSRGCRRPGGAAARIDGASTLR